MTQRLLIVHPRADLIRARLTLDFPSLDVVEAVSPAVALKVLHGVTGIIGFGYSFTDEMFERVPELKWLQFLSSGTDRLAGFKSLPRRVVVTSCQGIHGPPVSEMAFFHMLMLSRHIRQLIDGQTQRKWTRPEQRLLFAKTVVVVGTGVIAREFACRCKAFGMSVIGVSATPRPLECFDDVVPRTELEHVANQADFLVLLTSYDGESRHLVNSDVLAALKPTSVLINLSRGALCDEEALLKALSDQRFMGAGLDVFNAEPLPEDHPFWGMENVLVTPHLAGMNDVFPDLMMPVLRENVGHFLEGRLENMSNQVFRQSAL